jgi:hypothetical protein
VSNTTGSKADLKCNAELLSQDEDSSRYKPNMKKRQVGQSNSLQVSVNKLPTETKSNSM